MFTKIIVGVDGRDGGNDAVALARTLAGPDSEITLINAYSYESTPGRGSLGGYERLLRDESDELLARAASSTLDALDPHMHVRHVADVSPSRALQQEAAREEADLIVVGSCHHGAIGRVMLGDVSRGVMHGAHCPVAVAPDGYRKHPSAMNTIGVGYNDRVGCRARACRGDGAADGRRAQAGDGRDDPAELRGAVRIRLQRGRAAR